MSGRMKKLFWHRTGNIWIQLMRYGISGFSATIVDFAILTILTEVFGEHLLLVWTAIAFVSGVAVTYLLSTHWVFNNRRISSKTTEMVIFLIIAVIGLALTELFMWIFASKIDIHYLLAKLIACMIVFFWNFSAKKYILFRE